MNNEKIVFKYDESKYFIESKIINVDDGLPKNCTEIRPSDGLFRPKFTGTTWIESATGEEIKQNTQPKITIIQDMQLAIAELAELILQGDSHDKNIL